MLGLLCSARGICGGVVASGEQLQALPCLNRAYLPDGCSPGELAILPGQVRDQRHRSQKRYRGGTVLPAKAHANGLEIDLLRATSLNLRTVGLTDCCAVPR